MSRHPDLRKRDVVIRYEGTRKPNIESIFSNEDIARRQLWDIEDDPFVPYWVIDITVDGETFTRNQLCGTSALVSGGQGRGKE